ncbi:MAG: TlpA disulfide reductase family protein [Planctomycetota bacterium]|nr:TlpA disulfide reductase family protein [Planctomycetota bacterium]MDI6788386.1 TlpA disulfide reductase family protein [Planctomycetota bacterium]
MAAIKRIAIAFIIIAIALMGFSSPNLRSEAEVTINNMTFGELWMGEELSKDDLRGHVVGVEFWGIWCPPCRSAMPHLAERYKKHNPKGFILLGFHSTRQETKEDVIAFCKSNKVTFNIYDGGNISGVEVKGIPHFVLFDHNGNMVYSGHPMESGKKFEETMKSAPDWLTGEGPYKKLNALAQKIRERKELGKTLSTLKTKHLNSENADEKSEAETLVERLERFGNRLLSRAEAKKEKDPLGAFNLYKEIATLFKGDEIGDNAQKVVDELQKDKTFQDILKAEKELDEIIKEVDKFKPCPQDTLFNKKCSNCKKKNPTMDSVISKGKALLKKYPSSPAAEKVKEILLLE